ncbi:MAG: GC-type dockerin domain-anchored protein [Planctomycetota bacterium]
MRNAFALAAVCGLAAAAQGQVVINEVWENPPGSGDAADDRYEFIELYGRPGMSLDGYVLALVKGGADPDDDDIPGPAAQGVGNGELFPEIDEAFSLDGLTIGSNGLAVVYQNQGALSFVPGLSDPDTNLLGFVEAHVPSGDTSGRLANDGSSSYVLLRNPPADGGAFPIAWRKDIQPDVDFDGKVDFGWEAPVNNEPLGVLADDPSVLDPYQMIDDVAWSNQGGKEYVRSSQQEISDTPGFNPDAISRLYFFGSNPMLGSRFNGSGTLVETRMADEEWVYGEITSLSAREYDPVEAKGPTDLNASGYDGSCDPDSDPGCLPTGGPFLFDDIDVTGFAVTPGNFNDQSSVNQFRFVEGDLNFDGVVDAADFALASSLLGATLDDTQGCLDEFGMPVVNPNTMEQVQCFTYQGRDAQALLVLLAQVDDGAAVTPADINAIAALAGLDCPADITTDGANPGDAGYLVPDGSVTVSDLTAFVEQWLANDLAVADITTDGANPGDAGFLVPDGAVTVNDLTVYVELWLAGCP